MSTFPPGRAASRTSVKRQLGMLQVMDHAEAEHEVEFVARSEFIGASNRTSTGGNAAKVFPRRLQEPRSTSTAAPPAAPRVIAQ